MTAQHLPQAQIRLRSEGQRNLLSCLIKLGRCKKSDLLSESGATPAQLKSLLEKGIVTEEKEEESRNPYKNITIDQTKKNILSDHQREAFLELVSLYHAEGAHAALLYGVTGSGKTEVFARFDELCSADDWNIAKDEQVAILGAQFKLGKYVKLAPNFRMSMPKATGVDNSYWGYVSFYFGL